MARASHLGLERKKVRRVASGLELAEFRGAYRRLPGHLPEAQLECPTAVQQSTMQTTVPRRKPSRTPPPRSDSAALLLDLVEQLRLVPGASYRRRLEIECLKALFSQKLREL